MCHNIAYRLNGAQPPVTKEKVQPTRGVLNPASRAILRAGVFWQRAINAYIWRHAYWNRYPQQFLGASRCFYKPLRLARTYKNVLLYFNPLRNREGFSPPAAAGEIACVNGAWKVSVRKRNVVMKSDVSRKKGNDSQRQKSRLHKWRQEVSKVDRYTTFSW